MSYKKIERHTAHTIVSWPNPKQWVIVHTSDLMMIIRQSIYILSIITKEMGKLKTHNPTYCIMYNWENMLNLTHTLDKIYLTSMVRTSSKRGKFWLVNLIKGTSWELISKIGKKATQQIRFCQRTDTPVNGLTKTKNDQLVQPHRRLGSWAT